MNTPRVVKIVQCSQPGAWYEQLQFEEFTVIENFDQYYVVHTWNLLDEMIPSLILKMDCKVVN